MVLFIDLRPTCTKQTYIDEAMVPTSTRVFWLTKRSSTHLPFVHLDYATPIIIFQHFKGNCTTYFAIHALKSMLNGTVEKLVCDVRIDV